jgi:hypothetical protein
MYGGKVIVRIFFAAALACSLAAFAQQPASPKAGGSAGGSAEGQLSVTLTVVSSVGFVMGPDGEQRMIVTNAADPKDNVSRLKPVIAVALRPVEKHQHALRKKKRSAEHR